MLDKDDFARIHSIMITIGLPPVYRNAYCHSVLTEFTDDFSSFALSYYGRSIYQLGFVQKFTEKYFGAYQLHPEVKHQLAKMVGGGSERRLTKSSTKVLMSAFGAWDDEERAVRGPWHQPWHEDLGWELSV